jgi:aryl-alcohol dehydrogenase-like predicted oxidoreductase
MTITKRTLGRSSLQVAPLCFGGNVFGWTADEKRSFELLDAFAAAGFNFIDTADVYSGWVPGNTGGESETIIGKWMKARGNRDKIVLATKCGMAMGPGKKGLAPAYMRAAIEDSLRRLQTDYIDLYQAHEDDPQTPIEETLRAFGEFVTAGKVRVIGASNYSAARLAEALRISTAHGLPRYESLQPLYNLYDRDKFEPELAPLVAKEQVGVIPYYSLAQGFLSGKYRATGDHAERARASRVAQRYLNPRGTKVLAGLDAVAKQTGATQAQIAIAWLLSRPSVTAPIVSATSVEQLAELAPAVELKLDKAALDTLDKASSIES